MWLVFAENDPNAEPFAGNDRNVGNLSKRTPHLRQSQQGLPHLEQSQQPYPSFGTISATARPIWDDYSKTLQETTSLSGVHVTCFLTYYEVTDVRRRKEIRHALANRSQRHNAHEG